MTERKNPFQKKIALTVTEAAANSKIGMTTNHSLLNAPSCPFVLFVGTKKVGYEKKICGKFVVNWSIFAIF